MRHRKHILYLLLVTVLINLSSCTYRMNPSNYLTENAVKKNLSGGNNLLPLYVTLSINNFNCYDENTKRDGTSYGFTKQLLQNNAKVNMFNKGADTYGSLRCRLIKSQRNDKFYWACLLPTVATFGTYIFSNLPMGKRLVEDQYEFEIVDSYGNVVKRYVIDSDGGKTCGLYDYTYPDYLSVKSTENALSQLNELLTKDANHINQTLADSYSRLTNSQKKAMQDKNIPDDNIFIIDELIEAGDFDAAEGVITELMQKGSLNPDLFFKMAYIENNRKNMPKCIDYLEKGCMLSPTASNYYYLAMIYLNIGNTDKALENADKAHSKSPQNADILEFRGGIYEIIGATNLALEDYNRAIALDQSKQYLQNNIHVVERLKKVRDTNNENDYAEYQNRVNSAVMQYSQSMQYINASLSNRPVQSIPNTGYQTPRNNTPNQQRVEVECSLCHGKGWIIDNSAPSFTGIPKYCDECKREVPESHTHTRCPSCNGNKTIYKTMYK